FIESSADNIVREKLKTNPQMIWHKTKLSESFVDAMQSDVLLDGTLQRLLDRGALEDLGNGQYKLKKKINSKN
ncbi:MAG: hypothetical protein IT236_07830, partial [Bacteroidia bacterium]|nr:hypothetical protein [Bacteroidia bacterium]